MSPDRVTPEKLIPEIDFERTAGNKLVRDYVWEHERSNGGLDFVLLNIEVPVRIGPVEVSEDMVPEKYHPDGTHLEVPNYLREQSLERGWWVFRAVDFDVRRESLPHHLLKLKVIALIGSGNAVLNGDYSRVLKTVAYFLFLRGIFYFLLFLIYSSL